MQTQMATLNKDEVRHVVESTIEEWVRKLGAEGKLDLTRRPLTNDRYIELKEKLIDKFGEPAKYIRRNVLERIIRFIIRRKKFEERVQYGLLKPDTHTRKLMYQKLLFDLHKIRIQMELLDKELEKIKIDLRRM
jgi:hypothetical protein